MPAEEGVEGGIDVEEAARITERLVTTGVFDLFAYGQGNFSLSLDSHVPDMRFRPAPFIDLHRRMREVAGGIPVMALGRIGTPDLAERVVAEGYGDLVGIACAQVSDAAFSNKAREGREEEIRPCIFDNSCWGQVHAGKPIAEFHNPYLGEHGEADWTPSAVARARRVVVVGAGPAGLEAAWVAAARGYDVHTLARETPATTQNTMPGSLRSSRYPNITGATIPPRLKPVETNPNTFAISPGGDIERMSMSRDGDTMPENRHLGAGGDGAEHADREAEFCESDAVDVAQQQEQRRQEQHVEVAGEVGGADDRDGASRVPLDRNRHWVDGNCHENPYSTANLVIKSA